jgi:hypothetical protein
MIGTFLGGKGVGGAGGAGVGVAVEGGLSIPPSVLGTLRELFGSTLRGLDPWLA